jgi:hypothetical protein
MVCPQNTAFLQNFAAIAPRFSHFGIQKGLCLFDNSA